MVVNTLLCFHSADQESIPCRNMKLILKVKSEKALLLMSVQHSSSACSPLSCGETHSM